MASLMSSSPTGWLDPGTPDEGDSTGTMELT